MQRGIRRVYVETVGVLGLGMTVLAVTQAARTGDPAWLGVAVPWLAAIVVIASGKLRRPRRPSRNQWLAQLAAGLGIAVSVGAGPVAAAAAVLGAAGLEGYLYWYTRQHRPSPVLAVGETLPAFPLVTLDGEPVSSTVLRDGPHVILFYRGSWCPFCVAQVRSLAEQYRDLERRGVKVALVSPQPARDTADLALRFDAPMDFYVDADGAAAKVLDIVQAGGVPLTYAAGTDGDSVVPTVVLTDASGRVIWVHHSDDHRVRPEPSMFLEVFDREGIAVPR